MTGFFIIGAIINLVALIGFLYWAIKTWKGANTKRQEKSEQES